jgi:hypothetical protein
MKTIFWLFAFIGKCIYVPVAGCLRTFHAVYDAWSWSGYTPPANAHLTMDEIRSSMRTGSTRPVQVTSAKMPQTSVVAMAGAIQATELAKLVSPSAEVSAAVIKTYAFHVETVAGNLPAGVIWLYGYPDKGIVRRVVKLIEPQLARKFGKDRIFLSDQKWKPADGFDAIVDATYTQVGAMLNKQQEVKARAKTERRDSRGDSPNKPTVSHAEPPRATPVQAAPPAKREAASKDRQVTGQVTEGRVVFLGKTNKGDGNNRYQTFALTLNHAGREETLTGAELMRQCTDLDVKIGDPLKVTYMGTAPVNLPGREGAFKHLYRVEVNP